MSSIAQLQHAAPAHPGEHADRAADRAAVPDEPGAREHAAEQVVLDCAVVLDQEVAARADARRRAARRRRSHRPSRPAARARAADARRRSRRPGSRARTPRRSVLIEMPRTWISGFIGAREASHASRRLYGNRSGFCDNRSRWLRRRSSFGRDTGLQARMLLTMFLLGLVYVVLVGVLFAAGAGARDDRRDRGRAAARAAVRLGQDRAARRWAQARSRPPRSPSCTRSSSGCACRPTCPSRACA